MPTATVNGVRLHYEEAGRGPTLLLIHAFPVGTGMWAPQVPFFARRFRVVTYDVRGFGRSEAPIEPARYSQAQSVEDAAGLLTHLGADQAAACGLSMGGNIALNLALAHPERVQALVLCDTGAGSEDPAAFRARCDEYAEAAAGGMEGFVRATARWNTFDDFARRGPREAAQLRALALSQPSHGIALTARYALATRPPVYALEARLRVLRTPSLVVYGEHDEACVRTSGFLAATIPAASLWMVPGASHFVNLDYPDLFNERVLAFLEACGAAEPGDELDLRGEVCPYTFLKAKLALESLGSGMVLRVVVDNPASARDVPRSLAGAGHVVLDVRALDPSLWVIVVRKGG